MKSGATPSVTTPFVTDYADVTIKDLQGYDTDSVSIKKNSGFFVKYIIKTPPQTFGKYTFTVNKDDTSKYFKVCRVLLLHIGDNYPCTEPMPASPTGYETTLLKYGTELDRRDKTRDDGDSPIKGQAVTYEFKVCKTFAP